MVHRVRHRFARQSAEPGSSKAEAVAWLFDPNALTLGFARRFATYKRPNLLLHDPERLARILTNAQHPVQLVLAGKAHPQDQAGQALIKQWSDFTRRGDVRAHVVLLSDYDMQMTQQLVQGVDVWVNTPRRPWEASGTSGMKVLVNGGLNLSELDGWWAEAYSPEVGWAIGDRAEHGDDAGWDAAEAEALYTLLEREVIPEFYARNEQGIPVQWVARVRESMARLTPEYSASRVIAEYTEQHYLPAAASYLQRAADGGRFGAALLEWQRQIANRWPSVRFGSVKVETSGGQHQFSVQLDLGGLAPEMVRVELYADARDGQPPVRQSMTRSGEGEGGQYVGQVPANRPAGDYTPRAVPYLAGALLPLEAGAILWQR